MRSWTQADSSFAAISSSSTPFKPRPQVDSNVQICTNTFSSERVKYLFPSWPFYIFSTQTVLFFKPNLHASSQ